MQCCPLRLRSATGVKEGAPGIDRLHRGKLWPHLERAWVSLERPQCLLRRRPLRQRLERGCRSREQLGPTPVPPSAPTADPVGQGATPGVPSSVEVINLDDKVEEEPAGEASASRAPVMEAVATTVEMVVMAEMVAPTPAAMMGTAASGQAIDRLKEEGDMVPGMVTEGTVLATGVLANAEIEQRIREALEDRDVVYPVPSHPPMHSNADFIPMVRISYSHSFSCVSWFTIMTRSL